MKLIIQSDDLGITEAVSYGIAKAVQAGMVTCSGLFSNMPAAPFALELVKPYPQLCLGEDINLVAGRPCSDPAKIPSLVQPDGSFKTSGMHRAIDRRDGCQDHVIYEECLLETEAQVLRFMELAGKKPEYLHGHAYSTPATWRAMEAVGSKYDIPLVRQMTAQYGLVRSPSWYQSPFPLENQLAADPVACITQSKEILQNQITLMVTHCGYVDADLFRLSTYTLIRSRDLDAVTSVAMRTWLDEQNIQLISYRDLKKEACLC